MKDNTILFSDTRRQYYNLREEILDVTDKVLQHKQLMNGEQTQKFEDWLARKGNTKYAATLHSGASALEVQAAYYKKIYDNTLAGSRKPRVAIPTITFQATGNAFMRAGWDVTILDCNNYSLSQVTTDEKFYEMVVLIGIYGHSVAPIMPHPGAVDTVIEDGAQHWLSANYNRVGHSTSISFDTNKNLNNFANGGALLTDDKDLYEFAKSWRMHGKVNLCILGTNARMSEVDCAQMLVKAKYIDEWQARRADISAYWVSRLNTRGIRTLIDETNIADHCHQKFVLETDNRDRLAGKLTENNIMTKVHYSPALHEFECFTEATKPDATSNASRLNKRLLSLPMYPELTDSEIEYIADQILAHA